MANDLHPKWISEAWQEAYLEMCADPTDRRSVVQFAKDYNIAYKTVYNFRNKNRAAIAYEVDRRRKEWISEIRTRAWKHLDKRMEDGSDKAIELVFKLIGDMVERTEAKVDYTTPEDKRVRVREMLDEVLKKARKEGTEPEGGPINPVPGGTGAA